MALVESAFSLKRLEEEGATEHLYPRHRVPLKLSTKVRGKIIAVLFLMYLLSVSLDRKSVV